MKIPIGSRSFYQLCACKDSVRADRQLGGGGERPRNTSTCSLCPAALAASQDRILHKYLDRSEMRGIAAGVWPGETRGMGAPRCLPDRADCLAPWENVRVKKCSVSVCWQPLALDNPSAYLWFFSPWSEKNCIS